MCLFTNCSKAPTSATRWRRAFHGHFYVFEGRQVVHLEYKTDSGKLRLLDALYQTIFPSTLRSAGMIYRTAALFAARSYTFVKLQACR